MIKKFTTKIFKIITSKQYYLWVISLFLIELGLLAILGMATSLSIAIIFVNITLALIAISILTIAEKSKTKGAKHND